MLRKGELLVFSMGSASLGLVFLPALQSLLTDTISTCANGSADVIQGKQVGWSPYTDQNMPDGFFLHVNHTGTTAFSRIATKHGSWDPQPHTSLSFNKESLGSAVKNAVSHPLRSRRETMSERTLSTQGAQHTQHSQGCALFGILWILLVKHKSAVTAAIVQTAPSKQAVLSSALSQQPLSCAPLWPQLIHWSLCARVPHKELRKDSQIRTAVFVFFYQCMFSTVTWHNHYIQNNDDNHNKFWSISSMAEHKQSAQPKSVWP